MKVLAFDISSKSGWALFDSDLPKPAHLLKFGGVDLNDVKILDFPGEYPLNVKAGVDAMAVQLIAIAIEHQPDVIVIEEVNLGKQRLSQRYLEWVHAAVVGLIQSELLKIPKIVYISTSSWRQTLAQRMTAEDKRNNKQVKQLKTVKNEEMRRELKKKSGIKGKVGTKHISVRWANENYLVDFIRKDDDKADAISVGAAYIAGAKICDGR